MQTNIDLRPSVEINELLIPAVIEGANPVCCLLGMVTKENLNPDYLINKPIELGVINSISRLVSIFDEIGITYKLISDTVIDKSNSDELATMMFNAVVTNLNWVQNRQANTLKTMNYTIGLLTDEDNAKTPVGERTPFGDFFDVVLEDKIRIDSISFGYDFDNGDNDVAGGFFSVIDSYLKAVDSKKLPILGRNIPVFHTNLPRDTDWSTVDYPKIVRSCFVNAYQLQIGANTYQITSPMLGSAIAMVISGLTGQCEGLDGQTLDVMPKPEYKDGEFTDEQIEQMLQNGISPISYDKFIKFNVMSRLVTSVLTDPKTGVPRRNMLDIQNWVATGSVEEELYFRLATNPNIINAKAKILGNGSISTLGEVKDTAIGVCISAAEDGRILAPSDWNDVIDVYLDPNNNSKIVFDLKISPAPITFKVSGTVELIDSQVYYSRFIINTQG